ncbi:MAG: MAPEG family protein [Caulobacter sp.]
MTQDSIFLPFLALGAMTFTVLALIPLRRFQAAAAGQVKPGDFALGESANVPGHVALPNRNYMNLLELPVLFYAVCLALYVTGTVAAVPLALAWAYVGLRGAHSLVHLTTNAVMVRLTFFALSNAVLIALWVVFATAIWSRVV